MRIVFFVLLLANLGFWGWAHWIDTEPAAGAVSVGPTLHLAGAVSPRGPASVAADGSAAPGTGGSPGSADVAGGNAAATSAAGLRGPSAGQPAAARCRSIGPFPDAESAGASTSAMLAARGLHSQVRTVTRTAHDGYWVYLPAIPSAAERARVLARLRGAGIGDAVALVQTDRPEQANRISVGLFRDSDHAQRRADAVKRLGLAPVLDPHESTVSQYWLDFSLPADAVDPGLADIGQAQGVLRVADGLRVVDCPAAAAAAPH